MKLNIKAIAAAAVMVAVPSQADQLPGFITIDGAAGSGEWCGATTYNVGNGGGTVSLLVSQNYLYALFDLTGYTTSTSHNGELLGVGAQKGTGNHPSGNWVEFAMTEYSNYWQGYSAGMIDGIYTTRWSINTIDQASLPTGLQAATLWDTGHRVTELKIPLSALGGLIVGETINVVGGIDYGGASHWYPEAFPNSWDWNDYAHMIVIGNVPEITAQPESRSVVAGSEASFTVTAIGAGLTYQWMRDGLPVINDGRISGAKTATLTIYPVFTADAAVAGQGYKCLVTPPCGDSDTSDEVLLTVTPAPDVGNQLLGMVGDYYGLFHDTNSVVSHQTAGLIKITLKASRNHLQTYYTGQLYVEGERVPFIGYALSGIGQLRNPATRKSNGDRLDVLIQLDLDSGKVITGTVTNLTTYWSSTLEANRAVYKKTTLAPMQGRYTMVLPPDESGTPGGYGGFCLNLKPDGSVVAVGRIGDAYKPAVTTVLVSDQDGKSPFYARAYKSGATCSGSVWGWLHFTNGVVGGNLSVNKPAGVPTSVWPSYPAGFTNPAVAILGSGFTNTPPLLGFTGNGLIRFAGGILTVPVESGFTVDAGNAVTFSTNPNKIRLAMNPTGKISGAFTVPAVRRAFAGVILQNQNKAYGVFPGYTPGWPRIVVNDLASGSVTVQQGP